MPIRRLGAEVQGQGGVRLLISLEQSTRPKYTILGLDFNERNSFES
jgi:hypothetical protein